MVIFVSLAVILPHDFSKETGKKYYTRAVSLTLLFSFIILYIATLQFPVLSIDRFGALNISAKERELNVPKKRMKETRRADDKVRIPYTCLEDIKNGQHTLVTFTGLSVSSFFSHLREHSHTLLSKHVFFSSWTLIPPPPPLSLPLFFSQLLTSLYTFLSYTSPLLLTYLYTSFSYISKLNI